MKNDSLTAFMTDMCDAMGMLPREDETNLSDFNIACSFL